MAFMVSRRTLCFSAEPGRILHPMSQENLRLLRPADLAGAVELSRLANWNQTIDDWEMLLRLDPHGCFAIEADGQIVATTTLLCYGKRLAWIGMVLTRPEYRRRGFAKRLMQAALDRASELKIESIKLDATADGQPLYEKLGFKTEQVIERWLRNGQSTITPAKSARRNVPLPLEMDREAFGADRSVLLQQLASRNPPHSIEEGYNFYRNGARCQYLGPCVARDQKSARTVIARTLQASPQSSWYWDLLSSNKNSIDLAAEFGFAPQRRLERMVLADSITKNDQLVYAIAGFELG
jgi:predicted GNAT family N-acyltransferase